VTLTAEQRAMLVPLESVPVGARVMVRHRYLESPWREGTVTAQGNRTVIDHIHRFASPLWLAEVLRCGALEIRHQFQPSRRSCGQTCIAMLLGVPATEVIASIPDRKGTSAKQLIEYVQSVGWTTAPIRRFAGADLPPLAFVRVIWRELRHRTHWILWANGRYFDPVGDPSRWAEEGGRIMSFVALSRSARWR
jgi:hypothetical protein